MILKDLRVISETRYAYREEAPEKVFLPAAELWRHLPGDLRRGQSPGEGLVAIPAGDLFAGNTPGITLARLDALCPELVRLPEGHDPSERVTLPFGWLALHFQLETHRVELPPEPLPPATGKLTDPVEEGTPDETVTATASMASSADRPQVSPATSIPESGPAPSKRGLFASLPIFRRRHQEAPSSREDPEASEAAARRSVTHAAVDIRIVETETTPPVIPSEDMVLPVLETLWKLGPEDRIADQAALQTLFMTGEQLTLERVVCLASELPGLKACLLAHGDRVLCAPNVSPEVDLRTLSTRAMTMLAQIRESSEGMGLGSVPAVTLHAEMGALSFLHHGELCLLVFHAGHGFVPGVRERLQEVLGHLARATPALA